jgi:tetrapyrrole methylase family protein/MazG family protein
MPQTNLPRIEIIGLGPSADEYITDHTRQRIAAHEHRYLRTAQHPSAHLVVDAITFDERYETSGTFDDVYIGIAEDLIAAAIQHGEILYAVPGSPLILERTVRLLMSDERIECIVNPAMGFLEIAWARLGIDPIEHSVRLIDGHQFATAAAGLTGPLLVAHCHANWVLSDIKLAAEDADNVSNDDMPVVILHHLGLPDEVVMTVPWNELDHSIEADHLTSIYIPELRAPVGKDLIAFHELARTLRRECPWDREQTHQTLTTYLLEETYEVVDAIAALDVDDVQTDDHLLEELGDLLYQIEFHAAIAEQEGRFTMGDVARGIHEKLVRRHPHVFAPTADSDIGSDALVKSWDEIKKAEKAAKGIVAGPFDGIPQATGSLAYASAILKRANKAGVPIELPSPGAQDLGDIADLGMHLLEVVAECRRRGVDPEVALRKVSNIQRQNAERHTDA